MSAAFLAALLGALGCDMTSREVTLQGSGATFPAPLYKRWFIDYYQENPTVRVNYTPIGSGAGIRQFTAGLVSFGASDAGISRKEVAKLPKRYDGVLALPMTAGCIALAYNLPEVSRPIRLSRTVYLKIFLREITNWNAREIAQDNPGAALPDRRITVVTRADSSGTTYAFTSHLAAVADALHVEWPPGADKSVRWKESIAAQGNDGVASLIELTPGAIGYIEYGYAKLARLHMAALENKAHAFVLPDEKGSSGEAALEAAEVPDDLQIKVPDPDQRRAYPVVTYTWVLARRHYDDPRSAATLKTLLRHCLADRQQRVAQELGYIRLPKQVVARVLAEIDKIQSDG